MAITSVIRCLNHIACHYIIIFKHQQMWCDITGIISPCEKSINIKGKQTENWLESGCQEPQWRWTGPDYIFTPSGLRDKQRHTTEKTKKIHFLCLCNSEVIHCISSHSTYCTFICVFSWVTSRLLQFCCRPQEKQVMLLSCLYYRVEQLSLVPFRPGMNILLQWALQLLVQCSA